MSTKAPKLKQEEMSMAELFDEWQARGVRPDRLERLYMALLTIPPTSVSSERAFSIAGAIVTKRRAKMTHETVDSIEILKAFYDMEEFFNGFHVEIDKAVKSSK